MSVIEREGRPFEPERLSAVDLMETREAPEGFVVEVYRPGYEWNGSVRRPAHVKVARRPAGGAACAKPARRPAGSTSAPRTRRSALPVDGLLSTSRKSLHRSPHAGHYPGLHGP